MALKMKATKQVGKDYSAHLADEADEAKEVAKPVQGMTTVETKVGKEAYVQKSSEIEVIAPGVIVSKKHHLRIEIEGGRVVNLGNYESARVNVTLSVPCDPDTLEAAYDWATDWVSDKIEQTLKQAKGL